MNMEIAKRILSSTGLIVDSAWDGREAVDEFEASSLGTYMAILMDGHKATRTICASAHSEEKNIPIITMTADAFAKNVAEAYAPGMNVHIPRPIDIPTQFETLSKYLGNYFS